MKEKEKEKQQEKEETPEEEEMEDSLTWEGERADKEDPFIVIGKDDRETQSVPTEESPIGGKGQDSDDKLVIVDVRTDRKVPKSKASKAIFVNSAEVVKAKATKSLKTKIEHQCYQHYFLH